MRLIAYLPLLAACTGSPTPDVPFTGTVHRYAIDRYDLPMNNAQARQFADDLNGDGTADNQIGEVAATLATQSDLAPHPMDLGGLLTTTIEINAHDLIDDDHVGVSYIGRAGETATPATGRFSGGVYASERSVDTTHPANGALVLPLFVDADPTELAIQHGELDLQPDGSGGYTAQLRGVIDPQVALTQAATSTYQMLRSNPHDHVGFADVLVHDIFGNAPPLPVSVATIESSELFETLLEPDVSFDGHPFLSFGFQFHLVPCDEGTCAPAAPIDHCDDRVEDADETDIDCGGSCRACGFDTRCEVATDCQTGACDNGSCREPSCSDGIQDGFEIGVDCGTYGCPACVR